MERGCFFFTVMNIHDGVYNEIKKEKFLNVRNRKQQKYLAKHWIKQNNEIIFNHKSIRWNENRKKIQNERVQNKFRYSDVSAIIINIMGLIISLKR